MTSADFPLIGANASGSRRAWPIVALTVALLCAGASGDVVLEGVSDAQAANINAFLGLRELECNAPPWLVRWQFGQAAQQIKSSLEAIGYYSAQIDSDLDLPTEACWRARFRIEPGEPVVVGVVEIAVDTPLRDESAMGKPLAQARELNGGRLDHARYEDAKRALLTTARGLGYFDAAFAVSEVRVDARANSATVRFELRGGARYTFGPIEVSSDLLERRLIDTYIPFHTGDPFDMELVARARRNLADSGYFGRTAVTVDNDAAVDRAVPVRIELSPRTRDWAYSFGVGYATDTGVRLRADAENARLNARGHRVLAKSVLSQEQSSLDLQYKLPHGNPLDDWFTLDAGLAHIDTDTSNSDIERVGARHSYPRGDWIETDFTDLTYENFKVGTDFGRSRLLVFGSTLSRYWRDQQNRPTVGYRIDATLKGASQNVGSDTDFVQARVVGKVIGSVSEPLRMIARATAGWTWKDRFDDLPPSIRFFAGGDNSIRGYAYQSVGPEQDGDVIGGSRLLTGSVEFDYRLRPNWSVAAFVDSGSAYDETPQFFTGVGVGVRWYSPVGPIRIDVAHPLDDPEKNVRLYITVGPDL